MNTPSDRAWLAGLKIATETEPHKCLSGTASMRFDSRMAFCSQCGAPVDLFDLVLAIDRNRAARVGELEGKLIEAEKLTADARDLTGYWKWAAIWAGALLVGVLVGALIFSGAGQ